MFEDIFLHQKISPCRLADYGFVCTGGGYRYTCPIMDGDFLLTVTLDRYGNPDTSLTEAESGEPYVLYKTVAEGAYVGEVRLAIMAVLQDVADRCCEASVFRQAQTLRLADHAAETYGSEAEFLWGYTPANAILRRADSGKWYGAILTISGRKLGLDAEAPIEVLNLHAEPAAVEVLLRRPEIYPAWHMNKKSWYTVILDDSVPDRVLFDLLAESYRLAGNHRKERKT